MKLSEYSRYRKCFFDVSRKFNTSSYVISLLYDQEHPGFLDRYRKAHGKYYKVKVPDSVGKSVKEAEGLVTWFTTAITGARKGETLIGSRDVTRDALLILDGANMPPTKSRLDLIRYYPSAWNRFIEKLGSIEYFATMTRQEREIYLEEEQTEQDVDYAEIGAEVKMLQLGKGNFVDMSPEDIETILTNKISAIQIRNMFPYKIGSNARRNSLAFLRSFWAVYTFKNTATRFDGLVIDLETSKIGKNVVAGGNQVIYMIDHVVASYNRSKPESYINIGILANSRSDLHNLNLANLKPIAVRFLYDTLGISRRQVESDIQKVISLTKNFTLAGYKSLLQKIIRYGAVNMSNIESRVALVAVLVLMFSNPGSFVPDIQRYVTGMEAGLKRLAISGLEDSYASDYNSFNLLFLGALLTQRSKMWKPDSQYIYKVFAIALDLYNNSEYYVYDIHNGRMEQPVVISENTNIYDLSSALIDELRSLSSDYIMVRQIAKNKATSVKSKRSRPIEMPVQHCIDQHWAPEFVYLMNPDIVMEMAVPGLNPFSNIFIQTFRQVTGVNYRKKDMIANRFTTAVQKAQWYTLIAKQTDYKSRAVISGNYNSSYVLNKGWIAGAVGAIELAGRPNVLVTLKPNDPYQLVVIRKPSRDMKDSTVPAEREEAAKQQVRQMLTKGIPLNKAGNLLKDAKLILVDDVYRIYVDGQYLDWKQVRNIQIEEPLLKQIKVNLINSLTYHSAGVQQNAFDTLTQILKQTDTDIIRKAVTYLTGFKSCIEFPRISRMGGATKQAVSYNDVSAYRLALILCLLFPSAIMRVSGTVVNFKVLNGPLLWTVRDYILNYLYRSEKYQSSMWPTPKSVRKPWKHQKDTLEDMVNSKENNHFLWLPVGSGKTYILLSYLNYLRSINKLPRYVIYTLPSSAIKSIIHEIEQFGYPVKLMVPLKGVKMHTDTYGTYLNNSCTPIEYTINLIEHDHLRRCEEQLTDVMSESIFVIDEVHKALNESKRTAVALQLSRLSLGFVAMTGTPVIDTNTYKLIWWLEQIVPFEVNEKNFWVAANSMIAKKANTGVIVNEIDIVAKFTKSQQQKYYRLVPPGMGGSNTNARITDLNQAVDICYDACTREMLARSLELIRQGKGVMIVAKNVAHQLQLYDSLIESGVLQRDIFLIGKGKSIYLTEEAVNEGKIHDYKAVIVPISKSEGYTLTRFQHMITSVYPSNNATREQIEGRINRLSQHAKNIYITTIHVGILTYIKNKHVDARNLSKVLQTLADEI